MHLWLSLMLILLSTPLFAAEVYRWHDDQGVVHFSDLPTDPNAELISMPHINHTRSDDEHDRTSVTQHAPQYAATPHPHDSPVQPVTLTFQSPTPDATIRDNNGNIPINIQLSRPLNSQETLQLLLDGMPWQEAQSQTQWKLQNIDRGTHTLMVKLYHAGKVLAVSDTITVYLHRAGIKKSSP